MELAPVTPGDDVDVGVLLDECFGPERHLRTAYRLRSESEQVRQLGLIMRAHDGRLLGSIQYWRLALITTDSVEPLLLLGPLAVTPATRRHGVGRRLINATLALADASGSAPIMLIGDHSYYGRFGFSAAATGDWRLPGPVERHRLLLRNPAGTALPICAQVSGSMIASALPQGVAGAVDGSYRLADAV